MRRDDSEELFIVLVWWILSGLLFMVFMAGCQSVSPSPPPSTLPPFLPINGRQVGGRAAPAGLAGPEAPIIRQQGEGNGSVSDSPPLPWMYFAPMPTNPPPDGMNEMMIDGMTTYPGEM